MSEEELSRYTTPDRVATLRRQAGLTQLQVSELLDVSKRAVQNWETAVGMKNHRRIPMGMYSRLLALRDEEFTRRGL